MPSAMPSLSSLSLRLLSLSALLLTVCQSCRAQPPAGGFTEYPDCVNGPLAAQPICNSSLPLLSRALSLVSLLNASEKITRLGESYGSNGIDRVGLPIYHFRQNAIHGVCCGTLYTAAGEDWSNSTMFPHIIGVGATFSRATMRQLGEVISDEARAFANAGRAGLDWFTPNINLFRDPRWGRGQETPGEDPYLSSEFAIAFVRGMQEGEDPRFLKTAADCKHYAGYDIEDWHGNDRSSYNANITAQDLVESYLPPFEACVNDARVGSIMCSYNSVNGVPSCANPFFLQTILRERFHFDEYAWVVSDCGAIQEIYTTHHYTATPEEAVAVALQAGVDQDCGPYYDQYGRQAYQQGLITDEMLDRALTRQFGFLIKTGYFDPPADQPYRQYGISKVNSPINQQAALTAALQSIVLLKNEQSALPIAADVKSIALIGPNAAVSETLLGNYQGPSPFISTIPAALQSRSDRFTVRYVKGCDIAGNNTSGFKDAISAAQNADFVVYVGGLDQSQEAEGHDRTSIALPGQQLSLVQQLGAAAKRPIAAVLLGGGQVDLSALKSDSHIGALLWAGYPGMSGGEAIVRVLTGEHSPSGRLPSTQYPAEYVHQVAMTDQSFRPSSSSPGRTYRFYTGEAVYPFGHGLSYATFDVRIIDGPSTVHVDELLHSPIAYAVNITNTGSVQSDATVLAFYSADGPSLFVDVEPPLSSLFDFAFVPMLAPQQTSTLWFQMTAKSMLTVDSGGHEWLLPGQWKVRIGDGSDAASLSVVGQPRLMRQWEGTDVIEQPQRKQTWPTARASLAHE